MIKACQLFILLNLFSIASFAQKLTLNKQSFELKNVTGIITELKGEKVLKIERDLKALPFDVKNLGSTVDEPTYAKLTDFDFEDGIIEVKMLSQLQNPLPFEAARGFIGITFRINENDSAFDAIYLRPTNGRVDNQLLRNHTVQYYVYPDYKFDRLRKEADGKYETTAPVAINEWIAMRIEVKGQKAYLYINDARYSTFVVDKLLGQTTHGAIGLWVDIGTIGYFKDLKITKL